MAICKFCNVLFSWGQTTDGRFVPLIPVGDEGEVDRDYQDSDGVLRSTHRQVCTNKSGPLVRVYKLERNVKAKDVLPRKEVVVAPETPLPTLDEHVAQILAKKAARRHRKPRAKA